MGIPETIAQAYASHDGGDSAQALRLLDAVLQAPAGNMEPRADLLFARGNVRRESGDTAGAAEDFSAALAAQPAHAKAHNNLGVILQEQGRLEEAQAAFEQALAHGAQFADAAFNLGTVLRARQRLEEALSCFQSATLWRPGFTGAWLHLGQVFAESGRLEESVRALRQAIATDPAFAGAYNDLGLVLAEMNLVREGMQAQEQAVAHAPDSDEFKTNLGLLLMELGELGRAWELYEHRWRADGRLRPAYRYDPSIEWHGGALTGKRLRVWWEQGLGDTLCFSRFLPQVAGRFGPAAISLEVQPGCKRLLANSFPGVEVLEQGEAGSGFDVHVPLVSLPQRCGVSRETLPVDLPYLVPTAEARARWQARLAQVPGPRVGLVWASGLWPTGAGPQRRSRSVDPEVFGQLIEIPGVSFISLQKGAGAAHAGRWADQPGFFDWTGELDDFDETAALMAGLDLVITVDTSVTHLSGALGKPTWVPLRFEGGNLWLANQERSLWYPPVRVYRQSRQAVWSDVIARIGRDLRERIAQGAGA